MKYFIYTFLILGIGLLIYGYIYPTEFLLDINIHDTYYSFTYTAVATFLILFSLLLFAIYFLYKLANHL
ncbi:hypothetical protein D3C86_1185510 [compost metagenome]